jgi:hypothetical protein
MQNNKEITDIKHNVNMFQLQTRYKGSLHDSILNNLVVSVFKHLITHPKYELKVASNGLEATISKTNVYFALIGEDIIEFILECPRNDPDEIIYLWETWHKCCKAVEHLASWWPEMYSQAYLLCRHCLLKNSAIVQCITLDKVQAIEAMVVKCNNADDIPAVLISPPGNQ